MAWISYHLRRLRDHWAMGSLALLIFGMGAVGIGFATWLVVALSAALLASIGFPFLASLHPIDQAALIGALALPLTIGVMLPEVVDASRDKMAEMKAARMRHELAPYMKGAEKKDAASGSG